jgi:hypothetical protein
MSVSSCCASLSWCLLWWLYYWPCLFLGPVTPAYSEICCDAFIPLIMSVSRSCCTSLSWGLLWCLYHWLCLFLGPIAPAYPDVCCDAFTTGQVCEQTVDNLISFIPLIMSVSRSCCTSLSWGLLWCLYHWSCLFLGPVAPAYPDVCCDTFTTDYVCF